MEQYNKCKGTFLENEILNLFKSKFTNCEIFTNNCWKSSEDGKTYENDILIIYKNYALIIEAKGNNISNYTREGSFNNAKKDMTKLILKSAIQANGFKKFLRENKGKKISLNKKNSENNDVSLLNINRYLCLSVSINGMESLGNSQLQWFQELNGDKKDIIIPHIQLGHLMVILDILDTEAEVIHYLRQRTIIDRSLRYTADELDLLGMYLKSGLNLNFDNKEHVAPFMGISKEIDEYYFNKLIKPKCKRTKLFMEGIERFRRLSPNSVDEEILLLDIPYKGQQAIEKEIKHCKDKMINEKATNPIITEIIGDDCRCIVAVLYWYYYTAEEVKVGVRKSKFYDIFKEQRDEIYILGIEVDFYNNYSCGFIDKINLKGLK
ncbi:MAG TPA: hypothetical protein DIU45_06175 [Clostridium sp.]|nr:hypothetical protein [Clostridium sp.]